MNIPKHVKAEFKIKFKSQDGVEQVLESIKPELETLPSKRSSVNASLERNILNLVISAEDVPSLRASVNSYLRWIILSYDVQTLKSN